VITTPRSLKIKERFKRHIVAFTPVNHCSALPLLTNVMNQMSLGDDTVVTVRQGTRTLGCCRKSAMRAYSKLADSALEYNPSETDMEINPPFIVSSWVFEVLKTFMEQHVGGLGSDWKSDGAFKYQVDGMVTVDLCRCIELASYLDAKEAVDALCTVFADRFQHVTAREVGTVFGMGRELDDVEVERAMKEYKHYDRV